MNLAKALNSMITAASLAGAAWILAGAAGLTTLQAQDNGRQGLPQDWSHRHVLFSSIGETVDAVLSGQIDTHGNLKGDPRYVLQERKRKAGENAGKGKKGKDGKEGKAGKGGSTESDGAAEVTAAGSKKGKNPPAPPQPPQPPSPPEPPLAAKPDGDWSYSMGGNQATVAEGMFPAKYTWDINATPSCSDDFAVFAANFRGAPSATKASQTGAFSANVRKSGSVTITNGANILSMAPNPTSATVIGTFSGQPDSGKTITITVNGATLTVTVGGNNNTTACPTIDTASIKRENSTTNMATSLKNAVNTCNTSHNFPATASSSSNTTTISATPGSDVILTRGGSANNFSWSDVTPGTDGTNTCSSSTSGTFAISNNMATQAANLAEALNKCPDTAGIEANSAGGVVTVTARSPGSAGNSITLGNTLTGFAWSGSALAGGVDAQPSILAINNLYSGPAVAGTGTGTFSANTVEGGQSVTVGGVTLTASAPTKATGTVTVNSMTADRTVTIGGVRYKFDDKGGSPGGGEECKILRDTSPSQQNTNATRLRAAIENDSSVSGWACKTNYSPSLIVDATVSNNVVGLIADVAGVNGFTINSSNTTELPVSGGNNGSDGDNTGTNFAYWSGSARATTTQLAANLAAAIERNKSTIGAGAGSSGNVVTVTANTTGPAGNSITLGGSLNGFAWSDTTLHGGTNEGICGAGNPTLMWAYDTHTGNGGPVTTSPALSLDGKKIAFVENRAAADGGAVLHILRWKAGQGTLAAPAVPDHVITSGSCPAGDSSCLFSLNYTTAGNTYSSPFVDYLNDVIYVGDDDGKLWKITGAFNGAPAKAGGAWASGILVSSGSKLTAPVFDPVSKNIFVGADNGTVYFVRETGSTKGACASGSPPCLGSATMSAGSGLKDPPVVDPSTGRVFAFGGNGVVQADTALSLTSIVTASVGGADHIGAFDNNYMTSSNPVNGKLYVCGSSGGQPALYRLGFANGGVLNSGVEAGPLALTSSGGGSCSPLSAVYNPNENIDWLALGIPANCAFNGSASGCVMAFNITGGAFPSGPVATGTANGGTSGIIIDNISGEGQASSLYYSTLGTASCDVGGGSAGCAVKRTQSGLK